MVIDNPKLQFANPWWDLPGAIKEDKKLLELAQSRFKYYHPLYHDFPKQDAILTLRGPRQIGKTTLLKLLIRKLLLTEKVTPENVFYYSCDAIEDHEALYDLLREYLDALRAENKKRAYLFLDEVSFVEEWQRAVKLLADQGFLENTTVCLTGSNILDITFSSERLPGRRGDIFQSDIDFLPLSFQQFIELVDEDLAKLTLPQTQRKLPKLRQYFRDYLLCGGFPKTINEYYTQGFLRAATYESYLKWIEGDLHKTGRFEQTAYRLLKRVLVSYTTPVSYYKLAKESGLASYTSAQEYLEILEKMFVVTVLPYFSLDQKKEDDKKNKKVYLSDPFIRNAVFARVEGFLSDAFDFSREKIVTADKLPQWVEEVAVTNLAREFIAAYYGKSGDREVDLVGFSKGEYFGLEAKYQNKVNPAEFNWAKKLPLETPLMVLTKKDLKRGSEVSLIPTEAYLAVRRGWLK